MVALWLLYTLWSFFNNHHDDPDDGDNDDNGDNVDDDDDVRVSVMNLNPAPGGACNWQTAALAPSPAAPQQYLQCQPQPQSSCGTWQEKPCSAGCNFNPSLQLCVGKQGTYVFKKGFWCLTCYSAMSPFLVALAFNFSQKVQSRVSFQFFNV